MARHLKSIVQNRLKCAVAYYAPHSEISASHRRGVRYLVPIVGIDMFWGAMSTQEEGRHYRKHIIVRRIPRSGGQLLQLYSCRFPKTWSAACVANRELIKEAQRQAHALEHAHTREALEWRMRFLYYYFAVFKGGAKPEPGMKPYSRFYQYVYVAIYRKLKEEARKTWEEAADITFVPIIDRRPLRARNSFPLQRTLHAYNVAEEPLPSVPRWRDFCKIVT